MYTDIYHHNYHQFMHYSLIVFFTFFFFSIVSSKAIIQNGLNEALNVQLGEEAPKLLLPGDYHSFQPPSPSSEQTEKEYYEGKATRPDDSYLIFGAKHGEHLIIGEEDIKADEETRKIWWFANAEHERDSINSIEEWLSNGGHHHQMGLEKSEFNDLIDYIHTKSIE